MAKITEQLILSNEGDNLIFLEGKIKVSYTFKKKFKQIRPIFKCTLGHIKFHCELNNYNFALIFNKQGI